MLYRSLVSLALLIILSQSVFSRDNGGPLGPESRPVGTLFSDTKLPSTSSSWSGSVNLYSGQHGESLPLLSVPGRGGMGSSLSLSYSASSSILSHATNRGNQASEFGLGFSLGIPAIITDHKNTAYYYDDSYRLVSGEHNKELVHLTGHSFTTKTGDPWIITRILDTIGGREQVIGWTITRSDGSIHTFGDLTQDFSDLNATEYVRHFGQYVGSGVTNTDSLYPVKWNLKTVHDTESLNWVEYSYLIDTDSLELRGSVFSGPYVRASYLSEVRTSAGNTATLSYVSREDFDDLGVDNRYGFYKDKRIDKIVLKNDLGATTSNILFDHQYLIHESDSSLKKLLLISVQSTSADGLDSLPPTQFGYYLSGPAFGSMRNVLYSSGAVKEIVYDTVDSVANFSQLDLQIEDSSEVGLYLIGSEDIAGLQFANNAYTYDIDSARSVIGYWDGYWTQDTINLGISETMGISETRRISPDGWMVEHTSSALKARRWRGGYWEETLVDASLAPGSRLELGQNCFIAGNRYYVWDDGEWVYYDAPSSTVSAYLSNDLCICVVYAGSDSRVLSVKYDRGTDSFVVDTASLMTDYNLDTIGSGITVGTDLVAWYDASEADPKLIRTRLWDGEAWSEDSLAVYGTPTLAALPNGFSYIVRESGTDYLKSAFVHGGSSFDIDSTDISDTTVTETHANTRMYVSGTKAVVNFYDFENAQQINETRYHLNLWDGTVYDHDDGRLDITWAGGYAPPFQLRTNSYSFGFAYSDELPPSNFNVPLQVCRDFGQNTWNHYLTLDTGAVQVTGTDGYMLGRMDSLLHLYQWEPSYYGLGYHKRTIFNNPNANTNWHSPTFAFSNSFFHMYMDDVFKNRTVYGHKLVDTLFSGEIPLLVVSEIKTYSDPSDSNPLVISYQYFGGLTDPSGQQPRFSRVIQSAPYFESDSPDAFTAHYYYNDIDDESSFYDLSIYDTLDIPDLGAASFGVTNGGYLLDGMEYYSYSYDAGEPDSAISSRSSYFSILPYYDSSVKDVYRVVTDSTMSMSQGFESVVAYNYDDTTGQVTSTKSMVSTATDQTFAIDSVYYAFKQDSTLKNANVLSAPYENISFIDDNGDTTKVSRTQTFYEKKGSFKARSTWIWFDSFDTGDTTDTWVHRTFATMNDSLLDYDAYGQLLNSQDMTGMVSSVKLDSSGIGAVASAINATSKQFLAQGFEEGEDWDGWNWSVADDEAYIDSLEFFTGEYSLKMDLAGSNGTQGPHRILAIDDLGESLYYYSAWVKTNHTILIGVYPLAACSSSNIIESISMPNTLWTRVEGLIDLSEIMSDECVDAFALNISLAGDGTVGSDYAYIDDFRFHPLDARVSTTAYDKKFGVATSSSGANNYPSRVEYDNLSRPELSRNFEGTLLARSSVTPLETTGGLTDSVILQDVSGRDSTIIELQVAQRVEYYLHLLDSANVTGFTAIYQNGAPVDQIIAHYDTTLTVSGSFMALAGDSIMIMVDGQRGSSGSSTLISHVTYDTSWTMNQVTSVAYHPNGDTTMSISFADGRRGLQTRTTVFDGTDPQILVGGISDIDARGRVTKSYLPYFDMVDSTGIMDFTAMADVIEELQAYFNDTLAASCDSVPYSEAIYETGLLGRLIESGGPSSLYSLTQGKTSKAEYSVDVANERVSIKGIDQDSIVNISVSDRWGLWQENLSLYNKDSLGVFEDTIKVKSNTTLLGDSVWVTHQHNDDAAILLRWTTFDKIGRITSLWKVDYGTVEMLYDEPGQTRFMRNDKRQAEGSFVYFKYDQFGRKIEEGIITDSSYWTESNAQLIDFPDTSNTAITTVTYRWYYDHLPGQEPSNSLGALVRTENADSSYYKEFGYDPANFRDTVKIKLPIIGGKVKKIVHTNHFDGSAALLEIWPDAGTILGKMAIEYDYTDGTLHGLSKSTISETESLTYADYQYNAFGALTTTRYGIFERTGPGSRTDTVSQVDYWYNALGQLESINDTASVVDSSSGNADHFGLEFNWYDGSDTTYANGRPSGQSTANSKAYQSGKITHNYKYDYNELGWLEKATNTALATMDREYNYTSMGNRDYTVFYYNDTTQYLYDSTVAGSSKLLWFTGMGTDTLKYDAIGNMIEDQSRQLDTLSYDYRNLMDYAEAAPSYSGRANNQLWMTYDQMGRRVSKIFRYEVEFPCDTGVIEKPPGEPLGGLIELSGTSSFGPPGGRKCYRNEYDKRYYLWDRGQIIAIFDDADSVIEMFTYGVEGRFMTTVGNNESMISYLITDQLGSMRVAMAGDPDDSTTEVRQYINNHPFGILAQSGGNYQADFRYTGHEYDAHGTFKFHYMGARYYDDRTGQFTGIDKAGEFASGYNYVGNDPIMRWDPDGNESGDYWSSDYISWYGNVGIGTFVTSHPEYGNIDVGNYIIPEIGGQTVYGTPDPGYGSGPGDINPTTVGSTEPNQDDFDDLTIRMTSLEQERTSFEKFMKEDNNGGMSQWRPLGNVPIRRKESNQPCEKQRRINLRNAAKAKIARQKIAKAEMDRLALVVIQQAVSSNRMSGAALAGVGVLAFVATAPVSVTIATVAVVGTAVVGITILTEPLWKPVMNDFWKWATKKKGRHDPRIPIPGRGQPQGKTKKPPRSRPWHPKLPQFPMPDRALGDGGQIQGPTGGPMDPRDFWKQHGPDGASGVGVMIYFEGDNGNYNAY